MFDPVVYETLMLALEDGAVTLPENGPVLFLRAEVTPYLSQLPKDRLVCQNSFKPDHDALKAAGFEVLPPEAEHFPAAPLTLILPPRQKDETRALLARALRHRHGEPLALEAVVVKNQRLEMIDAPVLADRQAEQANRQTELAQREAMLGALDEEGRITPQGEALAACRRRGWPRTWPRSGCWSGSS